MRYILSAAAAALLGLAVAAGALASAEAVKQQDWSFNGIFGTYDKAQLQRGFTVYDEVCAGCHSLKLVAYRNLTEIGFGEDRVKEIAAEKEVAGDPDDEGEPTIRAALPSDRFVSPYANENASRAANNGALPPDLSLMAKARKGGPDYIVALLTGYEDEAPEGVELGEGMNFNHAFPGNQVAMAPPLSEDAVEYADGTEATVEQLALDVTAFLNWAAEPELDERKNLGIKVMLFLIVLTGLLYAVKKKVWADLH